MTPRPLARMRRATALLVLIAASVSAFSGCDPRQAMYFLQPFEPKVAAPCPSLKGKRVVVLTTGVAGLQSEFLTLDRDITRELVKILRENVKKIDVVSPNDVAAWMQAKPTWSDPVEAAKAFDADVVIFLEIRQFQIDDPSSPGMLGGRSSVHIQVTELAHPKDDRGHEILDRPKESEIIYEGDRDTIFPVTGQIPVEAGVSRSAFRNKFVKLVVNELSWHFVDHAPGDNIQDTRFHGE